MLLETVWLDITFSGGNVRIWAFSERFVTSVISNSCSEIHKCHWLGSRRAGTRRRTVSRPEEEGPPITDTQHLTCVNERSWGEEAVGHWRWVWGQDYKLQPLLVLPTTTTNNQSVYFYSTFKTTYVDQSAIHYQKLQYRHITNIQLNTMPIILLLT